MKKIILSIAMVVSSLSFGQLATYDGASPIATNGVQRGNTDAINLKKGFNYTFAYSLTAGASEENNARLGFLDLTGLDARLVASSVTPKGHRNVGNEYGYDLPDIAANATVTGSFTIYLNDVNEADPASIFFFGANGLIVNSVTVTESTPNVTEIDYDFENTELNLGAADGTIHTLGDAGNVPYGYWSRNDSNSNFNIDVVGEPDPNPTNNVLYLGAAGASHPFTFVAGHEFEISADVTEAVGSPTQVNVVINGLGLTDVTGVDADGADDATVVGDTGNNTISFSLAVGGNRKATLLIPASATNVASASISFAPDADEVDIDNLKVINKTLLSTDGFVKAISTAPVKAIYNTTGTKVGTSLGNLGTGVYILLHEDGITTKVVK